MKKTIYLIIISLICSLNVQAQKFAYIDSDYILNKIPEFKQAQDKLDALSTEWQKEIEKKSLKSKMILQIHDELLFEYPVEEKDILISMVKNSMESAMKLKVPIIVDYGFGKNWYEAH